MSDRVDVSTRLTWLVGGALPLLLAVRLPGSLDGLDSVNFALGLEEFDPGLDQPHFPGYPLYIALCRVLAWAGLAPPLALALPGVLASSALIPACHRSALASGLRPAAAWAGSLLLLAHPLLMIEGPRPAPDLLGCSLVWAAVALGVSGRPCPAGLLVGLALGVRLDLLPFVGLIGLAEPRARRTFALGVGLGLSIWLPLFLASVPIGSLPRAVAFTRGHFGSWGSSLVAGAGSADAVLGSLLLAGAGATGLLVALIGLRHAPARMRRLLGWSVGPYLLWVMVGQNLAHPRHLLPLAPALAILVGTALDALSRGAWRGVAVAALVAGAWPGWIRALEPPLDGRALVTRAVEACGTCEAVFVGDTRRLFERYAPPGFPAYRRARLEEVLLDLAAWRLDPEAVLVSSEIAGVAGVGRPVTTLGGDVRLYRIDGPALRYPRAALQPHPVLHPGQPRLDRGAGIRHRVDVLAKPGAEPHGGGRALRPGRHQVAEPLRVR